MLKKENITASSRRRAFVETPFPRLLSSVFLWIAASRAFSSDLASVAEETLQRRLCTFALFFAGMTALSPFGILPAGRCTRADVIMGAFHKELRISVRVARNWICDSSPLGALLRLQAPARRDQRSILSLSCFPSCLAMTCWVQPAF